MPKMEPGFWLTNPRRTKYSRIGGCTELNEMPTEAKYKARLVIKGFKQTYGIDYLETFESVCRYESIRLLLAVSVMNDLKIVQLDVATAYLHAELDQTIYMDQPEGFDQQKSKLCLLKKSLYELKQAVGTRN